MIQRRLYRLWSFVLVLSLLVVLAVRNDEVDASLLEPLAQRIGVVGALGDRAFRLYSRPTFGARNLDFGERGFRKRNFSRRATFEPNSQRKTAAVDQYHPLGALATLGFTDCRAPPFSPERSCRPGTSAPISAILRRPGLQAAPATRQARHPALPHVSSAAPGRGRGILVRQKPPSRARLQHHRIPSKQAWFDAQGWPSAGDFCVRRVV